MSSRKVAWLSIGVAVIMCLCSFSLANALETKYNNRVPYRVLFQTEQPSEIMVQKSSGSEVVQAVVPVNQEEENVEQQGLEKEVNKLKGD